MRISPVLPLLFALAAELSACAHNTDLIAHLNDRGFGDVNNSNIAAMVANPADLVRGHASTSINAPMLVAPIQHLDKGAPIGGGGGGGAAAGGGASSGSGG